MPRISAFHGLGIWIYYEEPHHPGRPHFHAIYGEHRASIDIEGMRIIAGALPRAQRRLVVEWAQAHKGELRENWARARRNQPLASIEPLP